MTNHTCGLEHWPRNINSRMDKNTRDAWLLQPTANVNALCLIHTSVKAVNKLHSSRIILDYLFQRTHSHWVPTDCELISLMYFPRGMSYEIIICKQFVAYFPFYLFIYFLCEPVILWSFSYGTPNLPFCHESPDKEFYSQDQFGSLIN